MRLKILKSHFQRRSNWSKSSIWGNNSHFHLAFRLIREIKSRKFLAKFNPIKVGCDDKWCQLDSGQAKYRISCFLKLETPKYGPRRIVITKIWRSGCEGKGSCWHENYLNLRLQKGFKSEFSQPFLKSDEHQIAPNFVLRFRSKLSVMLL